MNPRIFLLALGTFATGTDTLVVAGVLPELAQHFQVSTGMTGLLITSFALTYGLSAPLLAAIIGRWSQHRVLLVALLGLCLACLGSIVAPTFAVLLVWRALAGACAALISPTSSLIAASLAPAQQRGRALSVVAIGSSASTVLGVPLGAWIGQQFGWQSTFGLVEGLAAVALLSILLLSLPALPTPPVLSLPQRLAPLTRPYIVLALLPTFLSVIANSMVFSYVTPLLQLHTHSMDIEGLLLVYGVGCIIGNVLGGISADHFGSTITLTIGYFALGIILCVLSGAFISPLVGGAALFTWGIVGWVAWPAQQHRLNSLSPQDAGVVLALNNSSYILGAAAGAGIGGLLLNSFSLDSLGWFASVASLFALLTLLLSMVVQQRQARAVYADHQLLTLERKS